MESPYLDRRELTAVGDVLSAVNTLFRRCVESIEQSRVVIARSG